MRKIKITSSSFLVPNNKAWLNLEEIYKIDFSDYGNWIKTLLESKPNEIVSVVLFLKDIIDDKNQSFSGLKKILSSLINVLQKRLKTSKEPTIIFLSEGILESAINVAKSQSLNVKILNWVLTEIELLAKKFPNLYFVNLDRELSKIGLKNALDKRNWYFAHCHLSSAGLFQLSKVLERILFRHYNASSKVLVLDCDNTIWGGVIGEDGLNGISLGEDGMGKVFIDFQKAAKKLKDKGVILALASKNNEDDVWEVFKKHKSMILKKNDIVAWKINWKEKSRNISELSKELDIGLDSFVFWDDNPMERDKTRKLIPEMNTVEIPKDIFEWPEYLSNLDSFSKFFVTKEDLKKTSQYQSRAKFIRDKDKISDEVSYLKSIKLKPKIFKLDQINLTRAVQLCAKTNQFNLRTIRHKEKDLMSISKANKDFCFLTSLKDVYGDHGIIGLVCLVKANKDYLFLDTILMSCRVIGRNLDSWILKEIISIAKKHNYKYLIGEFIPTKKNIVVSNFFSEKGFNLMNKNHKDYSNIKKNLKLGKNKIYFAPLNKIILPNIEVYGKN